MKTIMRCYLDDNALSEETLSAMRRELWDLKEDQLSEDAGSWQLAMISAKNNGLRSPEEYFKFALRRAICDDPLLGMFPEHCVRTALTEIYPIVITTEPQVTVWRDGLVFDIPVGLRNEVRPALVEIEITNVTLPIVCGFRSFVMPGNDEILIRVYAEPMGIDLFPDGQLLYRVIITTDAQCEVRELGHALAYGRAQALGIYDLFEQQPQRTNKDVKIN